MSNCSL